MSTINSIQDTYVRYDDWQQIHSIHYAIIDSIRLHSIPLTSPSAPS